MSSTDAVSETHDDDAGLAGSNSLLDTLGPAVARHASSGNLAAASGVVSLVRAGRTFLKGDRKRGLLQAFGGLFWLGVAIAQRRTGDSGHRESHTDSDLSEVVDTGPDLDDVETGESGGEDHATGTDVVDTTDADIEADTTAGVGEVGEADEIEREAEDADVDERDVVDTDEISEAADSEDDEESEATEETETGEESESDAESATSEDESAEPAE